MRDFVLNIIRLVSTVRMDGAGPSSNPGGNPPNGGSGGPGTNPGGGGSTGPGGQPSNNNHTPLTPEQIKDHQAEYKRRAARSTNILQRLETMDNSGVEQNTGKHYDLMQELVSSELELMRQKAHMADLGIKVIYNMTKAKEYLMDHNLIR